MTRPEDAWTVPDRTDRTTTIRYGTVTATPTPGLATVAVVDGTTLVDVPTFGTVAVGTAVLVLHDGVKAVAVADTSGASAWTTYVPTFTGLTIGNGVVTARYCRVGRTVFVKVLVVFGTTTAVTGDVLITGPSAAVNQNRVGVAVCRTPTSTSSRYQLGAYGNSSTTYAVRSLGTNGQLLALSATVPATWADGAWLSLEAWYEEAGSLLAELHDDDEE